jgi:hypothetical protein
MTVQSPETVLMCQLGSKKPKQDCNSDLYHFIGSLKDDCNKKIVLIHAVFKNNKNHTQDKTQSQFGFYPAI